MGDSLLLRFANNILGYKQPTNTRKINFCISGQSLDNLIFLITNIPMKIHNKIILMIGTNDILKRKNTNNIIESYTKLIKLLTTKCNKLILFSIPPIPKFKNDKYHWYQLHKINTFLNNSANKKNIFFINLTQHLCLQENILNIQLFEKMYKYSQKPDLVHLNLNGLKLKKNIGRTFLIL